MPRDDLHQLLLTVLSVPTLEVTTATCVQNLASIYDDDELRWDVGDVHWDVGVVHWDPGGYGELLAAPTIQVPSLPGHAYTELRKLRLRWDGLSSLWINALLRLPRKLEVLHLQMNGNRHAHHPVIEFMPLDCALRPVPGSLRTLAIYPQHHELRDTYPDTWEDGFNINWGTSGFRDFDKLESIGIPFNSRVTQGRYGESGREQAILPPKSITKFR